VAETYPSEACLHLGLTAPGRGWSKRDVVSRQRQGPGLLAWAAGRDVRLTNELRVAIGAGFGASAVGEDQFDSLVGVMGIVEVLLGGRGGGAPLDSDVVNVEGWIFGQPPACRT
jgi:hypothetical protein